MLVYKKKQNKLYSFNLIVSFFLSLFLLAYAGLSYSEQNALFSSTKTSHYKPVYKNEKNTLNKRQIKNNSAEFLKKQQQVRTQKMGAVASITSSAWSNAFNFTRTWGAQVDPRTGISGVWIKVGSLRSNTGHGPDIDLEVCYSSGTTADYDGLSRGWNWNLTHFNPKNNQLITSSGQNFFLRQTKKGQWWPRYHKLHDIQISGDKNSHFVITYPNGLREILSHAGFETRLEQQDGNGVNFIYFPATHLLSAVVDDQGNDILLNRFSQQLTVISKGIYGQPVKVIINKAQGLLSSITLPLNNKNNNGVYIHYTGHLITQMDYPTGLKKTFSYNCTNAIKSRLPVKKSLCAVIRETEDPGFGQPMMVTHYSYTQANNNEHNYLAYNSGLPVVKSSQNDILFEAPANYTYRTVADNGITKDIRTYDKYHLLIDDRLINDKTGHLLSQVRNFFCRRDKPNGCAELSFADLPASYSLPLKTVTNHWSDDSDTPAINTTTTDYDNDGRTVNYKDSWGRSTHIDYCPVTGDYACPPSPESWLFSRLPETVIKYPAHSTTTAETMLLPVIIHNHYSKVFNRNGKEYILALTKQTTQSGNQKITTVRNYYHNTENLLTYGLVRKIILTDNQSSASLSPTAVIRKYYYIKNSDNYSQTTFSIISSNQQDIQQSSSVITSLFTSQILYKTDPAGQNITCYDYDQWGRLTQIHLATGTSFAATTRYQYIISPALNQVLITAASGFKQKYIFDGAGRSLMHLEQVITTAGKIQSDHWLLKNKITYDRYGRITAKHSYIMDHKKTTDLAVTYDYDSAGRLFRVHLPDGENVVTLHNEKNRCSISYEQNKNLMSSTILIVHKNVLDKPTEQLILPAIKNISSAVKELCEPINKSSHAKIITFNYDGFGRVVTVKDVLGRIIKRHYDTLGRLTDMTDPAGNKMHQVYDLTGHIIQNWAFPVSGGHYLLSSAKYNSAGQRLWSAGEDGKKTRFFYTKNGLLSVKITPAGHRFSWQYNNVNLPTAEWVDGQLKIRTDYNYISLLPVKTTDVTGVTTYTYSVDGLPQSLYHTDVDHHLSYHLQWQYDINRRIISTNDISGYRTSVFYDTLGRTSSVHYTGRDNNDKTLYSMVYDDFSRTASIHYGSGMQRYISYDNWGHQHQITDILSGKLLTQWQFNYDTYNNITMLFYKAAHNQYARYHYQYDLLNNLKTMTCDGSSSLTLCSRDTDFANTNLQKAPVITRQNYTFTPLNKISKVTEILQNTSYNKTLTKETLYSYNNSAIPFRLTKISTVWNNRSPVTHFFNYDVSGNMLTDGEGNQITYNAFNQITQVIMPSGKQSHYFYNGYDQEITAENTTNTSHFFYRNGQLINEKINNGQTMHTTGYSGIAKTIDGVVYEYYENNYKGDVTGVLTKANKNNFNYQLKQQNIYSPYGMVWHNKSVSLPLYQQTLQGFDGEHTDPFTGWQFLGSGHRTYNPKKRYFVSEDPLGDGYCFGNNNPIMNSDPDGNMPRWISTIATWSGYIETLGFSAIHKKWANIVGATVAAGLTILACGGGSIVTGLRNTLGSGVLSVASAAAPANKGLNIAAQVTGITATTIMTAIGFAGIIFESEILGSALASSTIEMENFSDYLQLPFRMLPGTSGIADASDEEEHLLPNIVDYLKGCGMARFITGKEDNVFLHIPDWNILQLTWYNLHFSSFAAECDTGAILFASYVSKSPIKLSALQHFYEVRKVMSILKAPINFIYKTAYIEVLQDVFDSFSTNSEFELINEYNLKKIFNTNDVRIIGNINHLRVIECHSKEKNEWIYIDFNANGSVNTKQTTYANLQKWIYVPFTYRNGGTHFISVNYLLS